MKSGVSQTAGFDEHDVAKLMDTSGEFIEAKLKEG